MSPEKRKEIHSKLRSGIPSGEIKHELRLQGYSEEEIAQCFDGYRYSMKGWYLFFGILVTCLGIWVLLETGSWLLLVGGAILLSLYFQKGAKT